MMMISSRFSMPSRVLVFGLAMAFVAGCGDTIFLTAPSPTYLVGTGYSGPFNDVGGRGVGVLTLAIDPDPISSYSSYAFGSWSARFPDAGRNFGGAIRLIPYNRGLGDILYEIGLTLVIADNPPGCDLTFQGDRVGGQLRGTISAVRTALDRSACPDTIRGLAVVLTQL